MVTSLYLKPHQNFTNVYSLVIYSTFGYRSMILDKITDHEVFLHIAICAKQEVPFRMCYIIIVLGSFNLCLKMADSIKNISS